MIVLDIKSLMEKKEEVKVPDDILFCLNFPLGRDWLQYSGEIIYVGYAEEDEDDQIKQDKKYWHPCIFIADISGEKLLAGGNIDLDDMNGYFLFIYGDEQPTWAVANVQKLFILFFYHN